MMIVVTFVFSIIGLVMCGVFGFTPFDFEFWLMPIPSAFAASLFCYLVGIKE